jgi:phosphoglycolate phosphatase
MFNAIVFDLDGTLLDSLEDIGMAANSVLAQLGKPMHTLDEYRYLVGDGVGMLFQRALPECADQPDLRAECMTRFEAAYSQCWHNRSKPYPGIMEMLKTLSARAISMSVLSNKPESFTKACVQHFFGEVPFAHVVGHSERFPRKPDPASAIWIGEQVGVTNDRMAYVGDTNTDMKTAVGASFCAIGVTWGFRPESELIEFGAKHICHDVQQLTDFLLASN